MGDFEDARKRIISRTKSSLLRSKIQDYAVSAKSLEEKRTELVADISEAVNADVIPQVMSKLPTNYTIGDVVVTTSPPMRSRNPDFAAVQPNVVGDQFSVILPLLYGGSPIYSNQSELLAQVPGIKKGLEPLLTEMATNYNLATIMLMIEVEKVRMI